MNLFRKFLSKPLKRSKAFTVGELTTATMVLGTISVITLGVLVHSIDEKKQAVAKTILNKEIAISLAEMYADGELAGKDLDAFKGNFQKYFPVKEVLSNDTASSYFAEDFKYTDENGNDLVLIKPAEGTQKATEINELKSALDFKFVTDKGVSVAIGYNSANLTGTTLKYIADKGTMSGDNASKNFEAQNQALGSIYGIYDVNGTKGPNQLGKDVGVFGQVKGSDKAYGQLSTPAKLTSYVDSVKPTIDSTSIDEEGKKTTFQADNTSGWCVDAYGEIACCLSETHCSVQGKKLVSDKNKGLCYCGGANIENKSGDKCVHVSGDLFAPTRCRNNGGTWNETDCTCNCGNVNTEGTALYNCDKKSNGSATATNENLCACECKSAQGIIDAAKANANKSLGENNKHADNQKKWIDSKNAGQFTTECIICKERDPDNKALIKNIENKYCMGSCPQEQVDKCNKSRNTIPTLSLSSFDHKEHPCVCGCYTDDKDSLASKANNEISAYQTLANEKVLAKATGVKNGTITDKHIVEAYNKKIFGSGCARTYEYFKVANESCDKRDGRCSNCCEDRKYKNDFIAAYEKYKDYTVADVIKDNLSQAYVLNFNSNNNICAYTAEKKPLNFLQLGKYDATTYYHCFRSSLYSYGNGYGNSWCVAARNIVKETQRQTASFNPNWQLVQDNYKDLYVQSKLSDYFKDPYWEKRFIVTTYTCSRDTWYDPIILSPFNNDGYTPSATKKANFKIFSNENATEISWLNWGDDKNSNHPERRQYLLIKKDGCKAGEYNCSIEGGLFSDVAIDSEGNAYKHGLAELADKYDTNKDGLVNDADGNAFKNNLALWGDANEDAVVSNNEIHSCIGRKSARCKRKSSDGYGSKILEFNTNATTNQGAGGKVAQNNTLSYTITGQYTLLEQTNEPYKYLNFIEYVKIKTENNDEFYARKYELVEPDHWGNKQNTGKHYYLVPNYNNGKQGGNYRHSWYIKNNQTQNQGPSDNGETVNNGDSQKIENVKSQNNTHQLEWLPRIHYYDAADGKYHFTEVEKTRQNLYDVRFVGVEQAESEE